MNARSLHPSARKSTATHPATALGAPLAEAVTPPGRACCCPAKAAVRVTMPPAPGRSHRTDLLLCGHHYRVSRQALTAAGATVSDLPGTPDDVAAWIRLHR